MGPLATILALECQALKYVREVMGLTNVILMVPLLSDAGEGPIGDG